MIFRAIRNSGNLEKLIDSKNWSSTVSNITATQVKEFEDIINVPPWRKMATFHDIFGSVMRLIHHIESCGAKKYCTYMLCYALLVYCDTWDATINNQLYFKHNIDDVKTSILN